ncbi:hypothetical protein LR68_01737 [Anoxybacillus sp. BCO1]|nr:hypothetical protein LR68_01737 [Anoxybacillus sp. BCO1]
MNKHTTLPNLMQKLVSDGLSQEFVGDFFDISILWIYLV